MELVIRNSSRVRMMLEQKSRRAGWIAVEDAGFDPASATARRTLSGSTARLVLGKVDEVANSRGASA